MTRSLILHPGGSCERKETPARETASRAIGEALEVVTVRHPLFTATRHFMYIDEWGAVKELPLNVKAWALYGGSPIFGVAVLGDDDGLPLTDALLDVVESKRFPDPIILAQMRDFITKEQDADRG